MDCGTSLIKYILFLFNILVFIAGVLGLTYGILVLNSVQIDKDYGLPPQAMFAMIIIAICSVVIIISFTGCCGAIRESVGNIMTYSVFMLILLIVQLVFVIFLTTNDDQIRNGIDKFVDNAWENEAAFDKIIQTPLKCCGKNGFADYALYLRTPPKSCCKDSDCLSFNGFYDGCKTVMKNLIFSDAKTTKHFGIGLIAIELLGFIFGCTLANSIRNDKRRHGY